MDPAPALETAAPLAIEWQPDPPQRPGLYPWRTPECALGFGPIASIVQMECTGAWVPGSSSRVEEWPAGSTFLPVPLPIPCGDSLAPLSATALRLDLHRWTPRRVKRGNSKPATVPRQVLAGWTNRAASLEALLITAGERLKWTRDTAKDIAAALRTIRSPENRDLIAAAIRTLDEIAGDQGVRRG